MEDANTQLNSNNISFASTMDDLSLYAELLPDQVTRILLDWAIRVSSIVVTMGTECDSKRLKLQILYVDCI